MKTLALVLIAVLASAPPTFASRGNVPLNAITPGLLSVGLVLQGGSIGPPLQIKKLRYCSYYSRCEAFEKLMRYKALIAPLLVEALRNSHYAIKYYASYGLLLLGQDAVPHLTGGLSHSHYLVRKTCAELLGKLGAPDGTLPLLALLGRETTYSVKSAVIRSLGKIGDMRAVPALLTQLQARHYRFSKDAAQAFSNLHHPTAVPTLLTMLNEYRYQRPAIRALGAMKVKAATKKMLEILAQKMKQRYYTLDINELCDALAKIGATEAEPQLIKLLDHNSSWVRSHAIMALGMLRSKKALKRLKEFESDRYHRIRVATIFAMYRMRRMKDGLERLQKLAGDYSSSTRTMALQAIQLLADKRTIPFLLKRLEEEQYSYVRLQILDALRELTGKNYGANVAHWRLWAKQHGIR